MVENELEQLNDTSKNEIESVTVGVEETEREAPIKGKVGGIYPYAGFWRRAIASTVDSFIILGIYIVTILLVYGFIKLAHLQFGFNVVSVLLVGVFAVCAVLFAIGYYILFECGPKQATLGKQLVGIKVVNAQGKRISLGQATGRYFAKILSNLVMYFGYLMAGFTKNRQCLHDILANTYVVVKKYQKEGEMPEVPFSAGCLAVSIVVTVIMLVLPMVMQVAFYIFAVPMIDKIMAKDAVESLQEWKANEKEVPENSDDTKFEKKQDGYYAMVKGINDHKYTLFLPRAKGTNEVCCKSDEDSCSVIEVDLCK